MPIEDETGARPLGPADIAVGVTHRDQRDHVRTALQRVRASTGLSVDQVVVGTANVLQGREFEIVVVWHPLSGRSDASEFHLDAGRLCVLLSRHRQACIVVSRGGIREQLSNHAPTEPVWLGETAPTLDGWHAHLTVLEHLSGHSVLRHAQRIWPKVSTCPSHPLVCGRRGHRSSPFTPVIDASCSAYGARRHRQPVRSRNESRR